MSRRTVFIALAVLAVLVVGGTVVGGWLTWAGRVAGDVDVTWSNASPACEGTTVKKAGSQRPVIEAVDSMRCVITVEVSNDSGRSVHLARAIAPVVGPRTGAVVTAENAEPPSTEGEHDLDALFPLDRDLRSGDSTEFDVILVFNPHGCNDGGTLWASSWPVVTIEVLGRAYDVPGDKDFAIHRDAPTPGCKRLEG